MRPGGLLEQTDALHALSNGYKEFKKVLQNLAKDLSQTPETRVTAEGLYKQLTQFDTVFLKLLWNDLLMRFDKTSENLQKEELDLLGATKQLQTLQSFLEAKRDTYEQYENAAIKLCGLEAANYKRDRKRTIFANEKKDETDMNARTKFRTGVFLTIIDSLTT